MLRRSGLAALAVLVLIGAVLVGTSPAPAAVGTDSTALRSAVTLAGVRAHQAALQAIADANGGSRVAGAQGHIDSAEYVYGALQAAGYSPVRQYFDFPFFTETAPTVVEQVAPNPATYVADTDVSTMTYSPSGDITAPLQATNDIVIPPGPVASSSNSGCEAADFAGFVPGNIALIQRGTCFFRDKALNAIAAGASGVIIFNEGQAPDRVDVLFGTLNDPTGQTVPVVGASFAVGEALYGLLQSGPVTMHVKTSTISEIRTTYNVYADTSGRADRTVVVGAHLDSVPGGPGINDNGSGSAAILAVAEQLSALGIQPKNRVRFAWWSAEEEGLLGSQYYVDQLSPRDIKSTMANLNFDMVGSPNPVRFIYDGDGSASAISGPNGSKNIEQIFLDYFGAVPTEPTEFNGRSDYGPFIAVGIPAGGLFTGAEGVKSAEQAAVYGGTAGLAYDPCYHQACDTYSNNNDTVLDEMSDAIAHSVLQLALTTSAINGTDMSSARAVQRAGFDYAGAMLRR
jgi:Zn-dependent M28 family amino/carboxypeptidase